MPHQGMDQMWHVQPIQDTKMPSKNCLHFSSGCCRLYVGGGAPLAGYVLFSGCSFSGLAFCSVTSWHVAAGGAAAAAGLLCAPASCDSETQD